MGFRRFNFVIYFLFLSRFWIAHLTKFERYTSKHKPFKLLILKTKAVLKGSCSEIEEIQCYNKFL